MEFANILKQIQAVEARKSFCIIAFSGGLDSTALLHAAKVCFSQCDQMSRLLAVHVNHGLSKTAEFWTKHCAEQCDALGVSFKLLSVKCENSGSGLEAAARDARYEAIFKLAQTYQYNNPLSVDILTAHHANDQVETLLFRQFRGTGPAGLKGIPAERPVAQSISVLRPFLCEPQSSLEEYTRHFKLVHIQDESNSDLKFDRNFVRAKLLPLIEQRWPSAQMQMVKLSKLVGREQDLLEAYASEDLGNCDLKNERIGSSISLSLFERWPQSRQYHVLRTWVKQKGFTVPLIHHLEQLHTLLNASLDNSPELSWANLILRRFNKRLYLLPGDVLKKHFEMKAYKVSRVLDWDLSCPLDLGDGFCLVANYIEDSKSFWLDPTGFKRLQVRFRHGGERCKPIGRNHSQTLKKLLQDYGVEPWLRYRVPLVYLDDTLIAVGDVFSCDSPYLNVEKLKFKWVKI